MAFAFGGMSKIQAMQKFISPFPAGIESQVIECLLINDDPDEADIFSLALSRTGLKARCKYASNGLDALEMLKSGDVPDIVFLDLNMPAIGGKECLMIFRSMRSLDMVPVVIYSTSTDLYEIQDTKRLGASHYLAKTPAVNELAEILQHLFYRKNLPYWLNLTLDNYERDHY